MPSGADVARDLVQQGSDGIFITGPSPAQPFGPLGSYSSTLVPKRQFRIQPGPSQVWLQPQEAFHFYLIIIIVILLRCDGLRVDYLSVFRVTLFSVILFYTGRIHNSHSSFVLLFFFFLVFLLIYPSIFKFESRSRSLQVGTFPFSFLRVVWPNANKLPTCRIGPRFD